MTRFFVIFSRFLFTQISGLFVSSRTLGLVGHFLDQRRTSSRVVFRAGWEGSFGGFDTRFYRFWLFGVVLAYIICHIVNVLLICISHNKLLGV